MPCRPPWADNPDPTLSPFYSQRGFILTFLKSWEPEGRVNNRPNSGCLCFVMWSWEFGRSPPGFFTDRSYTFPRLDSRGSLAACQLGSVWQSLQSTLLFWIILPGGWGWSKKPLSYRWKIPKGLETCYLWASSWLQVKTKHKFKVHNFFLIFFRFPSWILK